ncbi:Sphingomyelin phosphodiesterase 4 [Fasciolopsis buskii]|uniref:Sphingomyelin phosphodiesterase 4 n=1 Tax=Fasciolopsis buskii TaxID=27845 RepID=A0A8E0RTU7_9TREM|nr:Sphingomyelin phosphodiesterase 4 [Fasciolopsis buski]
MQLMTLMSLRPSSCHIYLVRLFAKHLYHAAFNHMTPQSITTPYQQALWNKISNFHKQLANSLCQQLVIASNNYQNVSVQLQLLLLHCFQHWPHDLSFEIVLETWLTAIQPWRYADSAQPCGSSSPLFEPTDIATPNTPKSSLSHQFSTWVSFAAAQYNLYSIPLLLFLQRAVCMDLRVTRNAYMVHRVVKVLSQRGFKSVLRSAEEALSQETYGNIKGDCIEVHGIIAKAGKISLWSPVFYDAVNRLIQAAQAAQFQVHASLVQKSETNEAVSFWGRILSFVNNLLLENGNRELKRLHKCDQYLTEMVTVLEAFFLMDQDDLSNLRGACTVDASGTGRLEWDDATVSPLLPVSRVRPNSRSQTPPRRVQFANSKEFRSRTTISSDHPSEADRISARLQSSSGASTGFASPDHTSELTPFDRFQILMGQRKPDVRYTGDRDFLPPCSYEVPILVELLNVCSGHLNVWMRPHMVNWCSRSGFVGWAARQTLLPASSLETPTKASNSLSPLICSDLNPKVSLRWLASYSTLVRVVILYFVTFALFGIRSPISFFVIVLVTYLLCKFMQLSFRYTRETIIYYCSRQ